MIKPRPSLIWSHALRVVLVLALLAIAPPYETAHALQPVAAMSVIMPGMTAPSDDPGTRGNGKAASHQVHDAACRILCFGWLVNAVPTRPAGLITKVALLLFPSVMALPDSLTPAPAFLPGGRYRCRAVWGARRDTVFVPPMGS